MTVKFNLSKENYINYNIYFVKTSKQHKRNLTFSKYLLPVVWLITALVSSGFTLDLLLLNLITWFIGSVLWLIFLPKYYFRKALKNITKQINEGSLDSLLGSKTIALGEKTIDCLSENQISNSNASYKYSSVEKIGIGYNCIFIFVSSISALIIPLSAFESNEQKDEFLKIVSEKSGVEILKN